MKFHSDLPLLISMGVLLIACRSESQTIENNQITADVTSVIISGEDSQYQFMVTISSPDTGCEQYADWWEVLSESGDLIYRRVLAHSHVDEQPFTRSGGEVEILRNQKVWVRGHMNSTGYGGASMLGSVEEGFRTEAMPADFALALELEQPLPSGCAF